MMAARTPSLNNLVLYIIVGVNHGRHPRSILKHFHLSTASISPNMGFSEVTRSHRPGRVAHRRPADQISCGGSPRARNSTRRRLGRTGPGPTSPAGRPRAYILRLPMQWNLPAERLCRTETPPHLFLCPIGKPRSPGDRLPAFRTAWRAKPDPQRRHSVEADVCPPSTAVPQGARRAEAEENAHWRGPRPRPEAWPS